ncbi:MAG TPA: MTH1187 family thiamine-binding protein [Thermosulfurimonas dismutans]|uniref:MTH1187 family thiamine-binding protein n=1 Tax=Thermosulfurimonas dismutans TaxID=999894 RepID=A0A7C3CKV7_9BACT|nr:MTH1187 family thiamine-binding protein [Thermosulfurimonas dismutans]
MALMEISVVPLGTGTTSVGDYIARIKTLLEEKGLPHRLTDMGTIIEGEVSELLRLAAELHEIPFGAGAKRVFTVIKIDDRRDREVHLGEKVKSVEERLRSEG